MYYLCNVTIDNEYIPQKASLSYSNFTATMNLTCTCMAVSVLLINKNFRHTETSCFIFVNTVFLLALICTSSINGIKGTT